MRKFMFLFRGGGIVVQPPPPPAEGEVRAEARSRWRRVPWFAFGTIVLGSAFVEREEDEQDGAVSDEGLVVDFGEVAGEAAA